MNNNKEIDKIKNDILKALRAVGHPIVRREIYEILLSNYKKQEKSGQSNILSSKVFHCVSLLEGQGLIKVEEGASPGARFITEYISLTSLGYQKFDAWYKKFWRYFTNDLAKILSILATILGIVSISLHIWSFLK